MSHVFEAAPAAHTTTMAEHVRAGAEFIIDKASLVLRGLAEAAKNKYQELAGVLKTRWDAILAMPIEDASVGSAEAPAPEASTTAAESAKDALAPVITITAAHERAGTKRPSGRKRRAIGATAAALAGVLGAGAASSAAASTPEAVSTNLSAAPATASARAAKAQAELEAGRLTVTLPQAAATPEVIPTDGSAADACTHTLWSNANDSPAEVAAGRNNNMGVNLTPELLDTDEKVLKTEADLINHCNGNPMYTISEYSAMTYGNRGTWNELSAESVARRNELYSQYRALKTSAEKTAFLQNLTNEMNANLVERSVVRTSGRFQTISVEGTGEDLKYVLITVEGQRIQVKKVYRTKEGIEKVTYTNMLCGGQTDVPVVPAYTPKKVVNPAPKAKTVAKKTSPGQGGGGYSCPPTSTPNKPTNGPVKEIAPGCWVKLDQSSKVNKDGGTAGAKQDAGSQATSGIDTGPTKNADGTPVTEPQKNNPQEGGSTNPHLENGGTTPVETGAGTSSGVVAG